MIAATFLAQYMARYYVGADPMLGAAEAWSLLPSHGQTIQDNGSRFRRWSRGISIIQNDPTMVSAKSATFAESFASARRQYAAAQSHAIYQNGHLIAVIADDSAVRETSAAR